MMQTFAVTIERTLRRKLHIVAGSADQARTVAHRTLPEGHRIIAAQPISTEVLAGIPAEDLGLEALDHILTRDWLPQGGLPNATISDWLAMAMVDQADRITANKSLAMAGLRVSLITEGENGTFYLLIASPFSHPQIADWTQGRDFGGSLFLPALAALRGAYRPKVSFTFAGIARRVVAIPMQTVMDSTTALDRLKE